MGRSVSWGFLVPHKFLIVMFRDKGSQTEKKRSQSIPTIKERDKPHLPAHNFDVNSLGQSGSPEEYFTARINLGKEAQHHQLPYY